MPQSGLPLRQPGEPEGPRLGLRHRLQLRQELKGSAMANALSDDLRGLVENHQRSRSIRTSSRGTTHLRFNSSSLGPTPGSQARRRAAYRGDIPRGDLPSSPVEWAWDTRRISPGFTLDPSVLGGRLGIRVCHAPSILSPVSRGRDGPCRRREHVIATAAPEFQLHPFQRSKRPD